MSSDHCCHCGCPIDFGNFCEDHETYRDPLGPSAHLWRVENTSRENRRKALAFVKLIHNLRRAQLPEQDDDVDRKERSLQGALKSARWFTGEERAPGPYCLLCGLSSKLTVTKTLERKHTHGERTKMVCMTCLRLDSRDEDEIRELDRPEENYTLEVFA